MMDHSAQRPLARRILIAVGAMLGASALFVGTAMLLLSVIVERVVAPATSLPAATEAAETAPDSPAAAHPKGPRTATPTAPSKLKTGDRS